MSLYRDVLTVAVFVAIIWGACGLLAFIVRAVGLYIWMRRIRISARRGPRRVDDGR